MNTTLLNSTELIFNNETLANCTQCLVWRGAECFDWRPCTFCNQTVRCVEEDHICQDNVCLDVRYDGSSSSSRTDPLGRVIGLILLTIFLLSWLSLCLKFWNSIFCGGSQKRCCVLQCAISVQCCCEWKAGRLRVIPHDSEVAQSDSNFQLYPQPPPPYGDIFPSSTAAPDYAQTGPADDNVSQQQQQREEEEELPEERPARPSTAGCWIVGLNNDQNLQQERIDLWLRG